MSAGISAGMYALVKVVQRLYQKYYVRSECHERTLEIAIEEPKEEKENNIAQV